MLSQLEDAEETLANTRMEHQFDLSVDALNNFVTDLESTLDEATKNVQETFQEFAEKLTALIGAGQGADVSGSYQKVFDLLMNGSGITVSADNLLTGANTTTANGSSSVVVGGTTYTPLSQDAFLSTLSTTASGMEAAITPDLSTLRVDMQSIADMMEKHLVPDVAALAAAGGNTNVSVNLNYDNLLAVSGNVDSTVVSDLKKLTENIADYTKSSIYSELKAAGITITRH